MHRQDVRAVATAASKAATTMIQALGSSPDAASVAMTRGDVQTIAFLLEKLATTAREHMAMADGSLDADGFRFWLPMPEIKALQEEVLQLRQTGRSDMDRLTAIRSSMMKAIGTLE